MNNFAHKVKLEQRHEQYAKTELPFSARRVRPQFLSNEPLGSNSFQITSSGSPVRPKSNYGSSPIRFRKKQEDILVKEEEILGSKTSLDELTLIGTQNQLYSPIGTKSMMRRRSCCCKWCGGASKMEVKHNDLIEVKKKVEKNPSIRISLSAIPVEKITPTNNRSFISAKGSTKVNSKVNSPSLTKHDMTPKIFGSERPDSTVPSHFYNVSNFAPDDTVKTRNSRSPKLMKRVEDLKTKDQVPVKDINEKERERIQQDMASLWQQEAKGIIRPVKMEKDIGLASVRKKKSELEQMFSKQELPLVRTTSSNSFAIAKFNSQTAVFQKLCKAISGQSPSSKEKINKLSTPMSSSLADKIRARNMKMQSLGQSEREVSISRSKDSPILRAQCQSKISFLHTDLEESIGPEWQSHTKLFTEDDSPRKIKPKPLNSQRSMTSFRAKKATILKVYGDDKSQNSLIAVKSPSNRAKDDSPISRGLLESPNILFRSSIRTEQMKSSFTETSNFERKQVGDEIRLNSDVSKIPKKKNAKSKPREGKVQWLINNFSIPKNNPAVNCPPLVVSSVRNKKVKRKSEIV